MINAAAAGGEPVEILQKLETAIELSTKRARTHLDLADQALTQIKEKELWKACYDTYDEWVAAKSSLKIKAIEQWSRATQIHTSGAYTTIQKRWDISRITILAAIPSLSKELLSHLRALSLVCPSWETALEAIKLEQKKRVAGIGKGRGVPKADRIITRDIIKATETFNNETISVTPLSPVSEELQTPRSSLSPPIEVGRGGQNDLGDDFSDNFSDGFDGFDDNDDTISSHGMGEHIDWLGSHREGLSTIDGKPL